MKNSYSEFINLNIKKIILQVKDKLKSKGIHLPLKRVIAGKGIMIAFVGVDGSGKTTFVHEICNFFKPKIDVRFIYFGHGKSHESGLITFFKFLSKIMMKININYSKIILGIGIGIDKNVKISMVKNAKKSGMLIVCDRFPQTVIKGMCDGPRLDEYHNSTNMFLRFLSKWEIKIYNKCSSIAPDIIFKIVVKSQTAFKRRSENKDFTAIDKKNKAK
jgi:thymidylate kinase